MIVCLTGKIGSGKTTCLEKIKNLNINVFEMDKYIHDIYKYNQIGYELIKQNFGSDYVNNIEVDRKKLGQLVFNSHNQLNKLNSITLPIIKNKLLDLKKDYLNSLIVVELAIFINHEEYFSDIFDYIIQIIGNKDLEINKIKELSWFNNKKGLKDPIKSKLISNSIVLKNDSTIEELEQKIAKTIYKINEISNKQKI